MVKQEIVEGLRVAILKGESLQKAMMSFFNAGYSKGDIEEAARYLQAPSLNGSMYSAPQQQPQQPQQQTNYSQQQPQQPQQYQTPQPQQTPYYQQQTQQQYQYPVNAGGVVQRVSSYGEPQKKSGGNLIVTFILIFLLLILLGVLVGVFLFREEISEFLSSLF